ncbi:uncharacterized protein PV09_00127 [Verruconis gallopava]|uniref:Structure-specific endonuclease subunit SLX4 n=1 Tax=Verruconis gallopava TaxID=253628 RepID=A0A0D2BCR9_9PEZI|nr:uncharacterized protein PV09_00127 [Verruconis gallopava]KIW09199.1 hypothetical protein PV09_00127 [Verruconis gallopava]
MSGAGSPHVAVAHTTAITPPQRKRNYVPNSRSSDSLPELDEILPARIDARLKMGSRALALPQNVSAGLQSTATLLPYNILNKHQDEDRSNKASRECTGKKAEPKLDAKSKDCNVTSTKKRKTKEKANAVSRRSVSERKRTQRNQNSETHGMTVGNHLDELERVGTTGSAKSTAKRLARTGLSRKRRKLEDKESNMSEFAKKVSNCPKDGKEIHTIEDKEAVDDHQILLCAAKSPKETEHRQGAEANGEQEYVEMFPAANDSPVRGKKIVQASSQPDKPEIPTFDFSLLHQTFSYEDSNSVSPRPRVQSTTVPTSKRNLELIPDTRPENFTIIIEQPGPDIFVAAENDASAAKEAIPSLPRNEIRKQSPKKGATSITARSIARYAQAEHRSLGNPVLMSPYFAPIFHPPETETSTEPRRASLAANAAKPRKRKSNAKGENKAQRERRKKTVSKRKTVAFIAPPKLMSPKQHEAKLKRQDLLFGTSSQLRQDGSPRYIREVQKALEESAIDSEMPEETGSSPIPLRSTEAVRRTRRKMWNESASIDIDSGWRSISDIIGDGSPQSRSAEHSQHIGPDEARSSQSLSTGFISDQDASRSISFPESSPITSNGFWLSRSTTSLLGSRPTSVKTFPAIINISSSPRSSVSPPRMALMSMSTNTKSPTKKSQDEKAGPDRKARLSKDAQIEHHNNSAKSLAGPGKDVAASNRTTRTPKKRGRPPKIRVARDDEHGFQHIDDIEDSEPDLTPSPPRRCGSVNCNNNRPLPLTTPATTEKEANTRRANTVILNAQHARWPQVRAKLFPEITAVIKSAPPTGNIKKPSWHEKMLLYDPIVLEDLTEWLNGQGLRVEGKDGELVEISCWMVQSWCEMNSVCCLWREGLRGGVRVKY